MYAEKKHVADYTYFRKKGSHGYTPHVSEITGDTSITDYILVNGVLKRRLIDVYLLRGVAGGLFKPYLGEIKLRLKGKLKGKG